MVTKFNETNLTGPRNTRPGQEFSRLLTAAVISPSFCQVLLRNPGKALSSGYGGESFRLPQEQQRRVSSIRATSLTEFANQLTSAEALLAVAAD